MLSKPMLTVHDVADLLKIKEATVRTWLNSGLLPAAKFGKEWRVSVKDLEAFVEDRMHHPKNTNDETHDKHGENDAANKGQGPKQPTNN